MKSNVIDDYPKEMIENMIDNATDDLIQINKVMKEIMSKKFQ